MPSTLRIENDLTAADYANALHAQSACNASGLIHSLPAVVDKIWVEARRCGHGTNWVNRHPILVLYSHQLNWLAGGHGCGAETFGNAYNACKLAAGG